MVQDRAPQSKFKVTNILPSFIILPRAPWCTFVVHKNPPWSPLTLTLIISAQRGEGPICNTHASESPPELRDGFTPFPTHTWRSQWSQHGGQLWTRLQPCRIPHCKDASSRSADTAPLSCHARPSYLRLRQMKREKSQLNTWFLPLNMLILTCYFITLTCPVFLWLPSPHLYMNPISFWMLNTVVIITDYKCQNWNINSGTGVGTGSAQSLESISTPSGPRVTIVYQLWTPLHNITRNHQTHT